jgi:DNA-directed RNA polymerase specialized sigma24 family protein
MKSLPGGMCMATRAPSTSELREWFTNWPAEVRDEVLSNYCEIIAKFCHSLGIHQPDDIAEITQDTIIEVHQSEDRYDRKSSPWPWIFVITKCQISKYIERQASYRERLLTLRERLRSIPNDTLKELWDRDEQLVLARRVEEYLSNAGMTNQNVNIFLQSVFSENAQSPKEDSNLTRTRLDGVTFRARRVLKKVIKSRKVDG